MRLSFLRRQREPSSLREDVRVRPSKAKPVEVQINGRQSLDIVNARDVSATGVGVYLPHALGGLGPASEVELVISLPGARPFVARGVVRHITEPDGPNAHFGVEFTELPSEGREQIRRYMADRGIA